MGRLFDVLLWSVCWRNLWILIELHKKAINGKHTNRTEDDRHDASA
jgi:hypothetical protein